ncbi:MAG: GNAT family N-acetyltransferase [Anaerolineaceae bacterium]
MHTDPWKTFGCTYEDCLDAINSPIKGSYGTFEENKFLGVLIFDLNGPFKGYIQAICIQPEARSKGLGSKLIRVAESSIFLVSPNSFLCYLDFNQAVKPLYDRLGYELVGELKDYMIAGHSEFLMRKTIGPVMDYSQARN